MPYFEKPCIRRSQAQKMSGDMFLFPRETWVRELRVLSVTPRSAPFRKANENLPHSCDRPASGMRRRRRHLVACNDTRDTMARYANQASIRDSHDWPPKRGHPRIFPLPLAIGDRQEAHRAFSLGRFRRGQTDRIVSSVERA